MSSTSLLEALLGLPDAPFQHSVTLPTVHPVLVSLVASSSSSESSTSTTDRELIHLVVARLARLKPDLALVVTYVRSYYRQNRALVQQVVDDAFHASLALQQTYCAVVPAALERALQDTRDNRDNCDYDALAALLSLHLAAHGHLGSPRAESTRTLLADLADLYHTLPLANDRLDDLRLLIVSTTASILTLPSASLDQLDETLSAAVTLEPRQQRLAVVRDAERYLNVSHELTERVHGTVGPVARRVKDSIGNLRKLGRSRDNDDDDDDVDDDDEWVKRIREKYRNGALGSGTNLDTDSGRTNGHGHGHENGDGNEHGDEDEDRDRVELAETVSSIQELFPDLSTPFVRLALEHPAFRLPSGGGGGVRVSLAEASERLVASLLEDDLPHELRAAKAAKSLASSSSSPNNERTAAGTAPPSFENNDVKDDREKEGHARDATTTTTTRGAGSERRNVYEDDRHFTKGRLILKGQYGRDEVARQGRGGGSLELDERLKLQIQALAERESSDEEDDDDGGDAFLIDDENNDSTATAAAGQTRRGGPRIGVRDNAAEDDSDQEEEEEEEEQEVQNRGSSNPFTRSTLDLLEQAYASNPLTFASDALTRRTNRDRIRLRDLTGLDDNQLEGWRSFLERKGEREVQKLRDKVMDRGVRGNHVVVSSDETLLAASQRGGRGGNARGGGGGGGGRGRGGRGGGRGGGGEGGGTSKRGKGDGGRAQHDRRKRGNDKKMQKMGATL